VVTAGSAGLAEVIARVRSLQVLSYGTVVVIESPRRLPRATIAACPRRHLAGDRLLLIVWRHGAFSKRVGAVAG
jgi:hypothetical protein